MPRARTKVSLPPSAFLSPRMCSISAAASQMRRLSPPIVRSRTGRPTAPRWRAHALCVRRRAEAEPRRQVEGHRHAGADGLAVQQVGAEAGLGLQRMAEGVAEIEQRAQVGGLALVGRHDARLGEAALLDAHRCAPRASPASTAAPFFSHQAKKAGSSISPYFATSA